MVRSEKLVMLLFMEIFVYFGLLMVAIFVFVLGTFDVSVIKGSNFVTGNKPAEDQAITMIPRK
jgi:hypothetical protein